MKDKLIYFAHNRSRVDLHKVGDETISQFTFIDSVELNINDQMMTAFEV